MCFKLKSIRYERPLLDAAEWNKTKKYLAIFLILQIRDEQFDVTPPSASLRVINGEFLGFSFLPNLPQGGGLKLSQLFWNSNIERILGTPCNKLGVNVFSFSPPLTSVARSLFRGLLSFSSHFKTSPHILGATENVGRPHGDFK